MRVSQTKAALVAAAMALWVPAVSQAGIILSTDFTGRTVSGNTAGDISWTTDGVADPGDLTAVDVNGTGKLAGLYDTGNAQGYFAPNMNTGNEGPWSTSLTLTLTVPGVSLEQVELDYRHFNNSGAFQGVDRQVDWTVAVTGSLSGPVGSVKAVGARNRSGIEVIVFDPPLGLTDSETYEVTILAEGGTTEGNNTGLDAVTFTGQVVPEPASLALLAAGALMLARRRGR